MGILKISCIASLIISLLISVAEARIPGVYSGGAWQSAHATFYGGSDASGTMGTYIHTFFYYLLMYGIFSEI